MMLDVCCDLTPHETSRWLELKPDRSGTGSVTLARTQRQTEYIAMIVSDDATVVGCTEVLFQPSFFLCCSTCCENRTRCVSRDLTRHSVSAHS